MTHYSLIPKPFFLQLTAGSKKGPGIYCMGAWVISAHGQLTSPQSGEFVHLSKTFVNVYRKH